MSVRRRAVAFAALVLVPAVPVVGLGSSPAVGSSSRAAARSVPGPKSAPEYWFGRWDVPALWASGARGQGVTIGEIDTGVTASLPELKGRVLPGKDFGVGGNGQIDREVNPFGHGTGMASIMVARRGLLGITGLAPGAKILPVAVPLDGTTDAKRPDRLAAAITWAADHGADVINLSIGGKQYPARTAVPCPAGEQAAVFHALDKGAVVVAAVGNTGPTTNTVEDPGSCLGVVSVGAVNRAGEVASFSSHQPYLDLVAPGVNIPTLGRAAGDAFSGDGTSQAAALVSASLALAKSAHPSLTGSQLVSRLFATLDEHTSTASPSYGYGQLDAAALVRAHVPADATNPVYESADPFYRRYLALRSGPAADVRPAGAAPSSRSAVGGSDRASGASDEVRHGLALVAVGLILLLGVLRVGVLRVSVPRARERRRGAPRGSPR